MLTGFKIFIFHFFFNLNMILSRRNIFVFIKKNYFQNLEILNIFEFKNFFNRVPAIQNSTIKLKILIEK